MNGFVQTIFFSFYYRTRIDTGMHNMPSVQLLFCLVYLVSRVAECKTNLRIDV